MVRGLLLPSRSWKLGAGSVLGIALTGVFVGAEVLLAGAGALILHRKGPGRWIAWWAAVVFGLHVIPLALLLADVSIAVFGVLPTAALLAVIPLLPLARRRHRRTRLRTGIVGRQAR